MPGKKKRKPESGSSDLAQRAASRRNKADFKATFRANEPRSSLMADILLGPKPKKIKGIGKSAHKAVKAGIATDTDERRRRRGQKSGSSGNSRKK